ncbi:MAG: aldo/keto reductase [Armatimonadota bacterium]
MWRKQVGRMAARLKRIGKRLLQQAEYQWFPNDSLPPVSPNNNLKRSCLGNTGIAVTEICFGALCMGPCQKNYDLAYSTELVSTALKNGINFIDTAHIYRTYMPIALAMKRTGLRPVITTKSLAIEYDTMKRDVETAFCELCLKRVDIFLLHGARANADVFEVREGAWRCLKEYKAKGRIRAIGISTHSVAVTRLAAERDDVDIIFPLINIDGLGIMHGGREEMEEAISLCRKCGKGVYLMKALGGGNLANNYLDAMSYVRGIEGSSAIAVGMISADELQYNIDFFSGIVRENPEMDNKRLFVSAGLCKGCGRCVNACPNNAISITNKVAIISSESCLTCGYCVTECGEFAIRMV